MRPIRRDNAERAPGSRAVLPAALLLAFGASTVFAADAAPKPAADAAPKATPEAQPAPSAADAAQAREELQTMREQMREMSRRMADLSAKLGDTGPRAYTYRYFGDTDRAIIGVVFSDNDNPHGLRVDAVTPGGPAEKAGLKHGDVITSVDGKPVAKGGGNSLSWPLHDLKVDQQVKLGFERDGKHSEITVKAERREPFNLAFTFDPDQLKLDKLEELGHQMASPEYQARIQHQVERATHQAEMAATRAAEKAQHAMEHINFNFMSPWWGLNLANLNADLGSYFGTDKGVLVLSTDSDSLKQLKSGDVLLDVDGSKVERPEDALRLLREKPAGSDVKVQVLRQHKPLTLTMKTPEFHSMFVPPPPPPPAPPAPAARPAVPATPAPPARAALPAPPAPPASPPPPPDGSDTA